MRAQQHLKCDDHVWPLEETTSLVSVDAVGQATPQIMVRSEDRVGRVQHSICLPEAHQLRLPRSSIIHMHTTQHKVGFVLKEVFQPALHFQDRPPDLVASQRSSLSNVNWDHADRDGKHRPLGTVHETMEVSAGMAGAVDDPSHLVEQVPTMTCVHIHGSFLVQCAWLPSHSVHHGCNLRSSQSAFCLR